MSLMQFHLTLDELLSIETALDLAVEFARDTLAERDAKLGRATYKNRTVAECIERDIAKIADAQTVVRDILGGVNPESDHTL